MSEIEKIPIVIREVVQLNDPEYFCNKSWTLSYNVNTKSWVSFHSYIPNFYIAENNFFYSGLNSCCDSDVELDVISAIVLPPEPTTTTTSTSSSTTSSTTTKALDCNIIGTIVINDCSLEGTAINISEECLCYTLTNTTTNTSAYSYIPCLGSTPIPGTLTANQTIGVCAKNGSVTAVMGVDVFPGGICSDDAECTITTTTSSTTTQCPNCKTYTLENETNSSKTATNLVYCDTGLIYSFTVPANSIRHVCSCNVPTVPTGLTSTEFGSGCTTCFCYTVTNIEGVENYINYIACDGTIMENQPVPAYSYIYICAKEATLIPGSSAISYVGGTTSCTDDIDCDCWNC